MLNPTLPSNVPRPGQGTVSDAPSSSMTVPSNGAPRIKTEPGYDASGFQSNGLPPNYGNNIARERAAQNIQQKFGPVAVGQIAQLQGPSAQQQRSPMSMNMHQNASPQMTEQQRAMQAEYQRRQAADQYQRMQQNQQRPVTTNAQTDGADEWDDYVAQRWSEALENPGAVRNADLTIREQVEQANRAIEGGGLMMPLAEQSRQPQSKRRRIDASVASLAAAQVSTANRVPKLSQLDGVDDGEDEDSKAGVKDELFEDDDEDAINSDLDDPDDNAIEEEQEDGHPSQIMLCTYDKVQRVKNKWKCTLRDGVLNTGGKEWVDEISAEKSHADET